MARNTKLTDELIENFSRGISIGLNIKGACDYAGISEPSYYAYIKQAEEDFNNEIETKYTEFFNAVKKAKASFRIYHMSKIREAAESGNWQASAWSLERMFPDEYGKQEKIIVSEIDQNVIDEVEKAVMDK